MYSGVCYSSSSNIKTRPGALVCTLVKSMMGKELPEETTVMTCSSTARPSSLSTLPQSLSSTWEQSSGSYSLLALYYRTEKLITRGTSQQTQQLAIERQQYLITKSRAYMSCFRSNNNSFLICLDHNRQARQGYSTSQQSNCKSVHQNGGFFIKIVLKDLLA